MGRFLKIFFILLAGIVGVFVIAAVYLMLFFEPNDFRDQISTAVKESTGRDLVIEGDITLSVFPWLAVEIGRAELGNASGFAGEKFLSFERASLSVRIMPLIVDRQVEVGSASLDGLTVNLEVAGDGGTNWDDLTAASGGENESGGTAGFDVASIAVTNANVAYTDAAAGSAYTVSGLSFETGRIAADTPVDLRAEFDFASSPGELGGHVAMRGTATMSAGAEQLSLQGFNVSGTLDGIVATTTEFNFDARAINVDTAAQNIDPGEMDLSVLGMSMAADIEPFSYAGTPEAVAKLSVAEFSLKDLMRTLDIAPPETADPEALEHVSFSAKATVRKNDISLSGMTLDLDDSMMTGSLSVPTTATGALGFDLEVDTIDVDRYMAPADQGAAAEDSGDIEIPADLVRTLNVAGSFRIAEAFLAGMEFSNLTLGVNGSGGKLRLHPLAADFYDGGYSGDVRIDASADVPAISVDENISGVNLGSMMKAMFGVDNISGSIQGHFALRGSGQTMSAIQRDLDGKLSIQLADGAWEGTDVWQQLRTARALFRQEPPPEPTLPARTEFSSVSASGVVTDGIFTNDDFLAELPFLRLSGGGTVDLGTFEVDYALQVRVLDRPEFMAGATEAEIADFTKTAVPLKITGPLSSPSVRPDIEGIFRARVEETIDKEKKKLQKKLFDKLLGPEEPPADPQTQPEDEKDPQEKQEEDPLKKIFGH